MQYGTSKTGERGGAIYLDAVLELGVVVHLAAEVDDDEVLRVILLKKASHV